MQWFAISASEYQTNLETCSSLQAASHIKRRHSKSMLQVMAIHMPIQPFCLNRSQFVKPCLSKVCPRQEMTQLKEIQRKLQLKWWLPTLWGKKNCLSVSASATESDSGQYAAKVSPAVMERIKTPSAWESNNCMTLTGGSAKPFHGKGTFKLKQEASTGCGLQTQSWKGLWGWILSKSLKHIRDQAHLILCIFGVFWSERLGPSAVC